MRAHPSIQSRAAEAVLVLACAAWASGQTEPRQLLPVLEEEIQTPEVTAYQLRRFVLSRIAKLPTPASPEQWTAEAKRLRQRVLNEVMFHGWPKEWVEAAPRFEDMGSIPSGKGYRIRKLRYEIVPGFASTDMFASIDYAHLTAMRAPRPTLLIYNAEDNCCFRAAFVKRENFDAVLPFFRLYWIHWRPHGQVEVSDAPC